MLRIENLSLYFRDRDSTPNQVVDNFNLKIEAGEIVGLIGESGSGKSMTAQSIIRLLPYNTYYSKNSKIYMHGDDLLELPEHEMRTLRGADIAMIFQDPMTSLNPVLKVGAQILEVLRLHKNLRGRDAYEQALRILEQVQISNPVRCFESYPHELSGGMQQRVMIAIALVGSPSLLIADEPTTALDVTTQAQILALLKKLCDQHHMAMLLITHDLSIAAKITQRIVVMQQGKIVEQNATTKFFAQPLNAYSKRLLQCIPSNLPRKASTAATTTDSIMNINDLRVHYPIKSGVLRRTVDYTKAVDGVDFTIYAGRTLAIVGESGCGKTTIAKAVLGLLPEAKGEVLYEQQNILTNIRAINRDFRSNVQMIFQNPYGALNPKLKISQSLEEGIRSLLQINDQDKCQKIIDDLLLRVGLKTEFKTRYPHELSGGERQRICIARALSVNPKLIVCDEPTSSLDVSVQAQVIELLQQLQVEQNIAYLFISHDLRLVRAIADQVAVMQGGKIVEFGIAQQVLLDPQHVYTKQLLQAV